MVLEPGSGCETTRDLKADPLQIQQVLLNLALNARDAIDDRGTLTVGTRNLDSGTESPDGHGLKPGRTSPSRSAIPDTG